MKLNNIKKLIITFSIIIVILIIVTGYIIHYKNKGTSYEDSPITQFEQQVNYEVSTNIEKVKNKNKYYTVKLLTERYLTYIKDLYSEDTEIQELTTKALLDVLDGQYKEKFEVNQENIKEKYVKLSEGESVVINNMYYIEKSTSFNIFLVYGKLEISKEEIKLLIKIDSQKERFSVFPEEFIEEYNYSENMTPEDYNIAHDIEENEYNKFKYTSVSDERIVKEYFNKLKDQILLNSNNVYDLLDEEYKAARFSTEEEFAQYIEKNIADFSQIEIQSYKVNDYDDYKEYICIDQFQNEYVFIEYAIYDYKVKLDRYTIKNDEFKELYGSAKEQEKVSINIGLWIEMLNRRDYKSAYQVLNETFRRNNFETEETFENYMREHFPLHYNVEYTKVTEENGIYVQDITLRDITSNDENILKTSIIMQLKDDYNFTMSFSI